MTPQEAQKKINSIKTRPTGSVRLRVVGSVDNPDADGPGARLQIARKEAGLSVNQIAEALKLRPDQIAAIESMHFGKLPGLGYALGYVRAYAELLDLPDVKGLVDDFKDAWSPQQKRHEENRHVFSSKLALPIGVFASIVLFGWLIITLYVQSAIPRNDDTIERPDAAIKEWSQTQIDAKTNAIVQIDPEISIYAHRNVKIAIRGEDGALVAERYLNAGQIIGVDGLGRFIISTPDAGALELRGFGQVVAVGGNYEPVENWRIPDIKLMAEQKAAEARAIEAEKLAKLQPKADMTTTQPPLTNAVAPVSIVPNNIPPTNVPQNIAPNR